MCRIAGVALLNIGGEREKILKSMVNVLSHGGPDDEGTYFDNLIALGHRRLSIIELSKAGHQPMATAEGQLVITYNGEIYNYKSLRGELERLGRGFQTKTDTEVILQAYAQWGAAAFDKFEGIFAFALYDKANESVLLVRDHVGVKPLYYSLDNEKLIFASEVRAFKAADSNWKENEDWKTLFLTFGSVPQPYSTLDQVFQILPGHYLEVNLKTFKSSFHEYYRKRKDDAYLSKSSEEDLEKMREVLAHSVEKNLISDAPIGVFLSGGIDSSLLTLLADQRVNGIKTISVNFDESAYDEYRYQKIVLERTKNVDHTSYRITESMFWESLPDIWEAMDQPTIDGVNAYFVSKCAQRDGLKAVLSGLGADEIFGGYASFKRIRLLSVIKALPLKRTIADIVGIRNHAYRRLKFLNLPGAIGDYLFLRGIYTPDVVSRLLEIPEWKVWEILKRLKVVLPKSRGNKEYASQLETNIYMVNQLLKDTDSMSMWHGLEVRVPFLDIELLHAVESIPHSNRYNNQHKYLLTASHQDLLPQAIVHREKKGFTFPMAQWMKNSPGRFRELIDHTTTADGIISGFEEGNDHWSKYWSLAVLNKFNS